MENNGGLLVGNSHSNGGIKIKTPEGFIEAEGGEVIVNRRALSLEDEFVCTGTPKDITSKVNEMRGGVSWSDKGSCRLVKKAADGTEIADDIYRANEGVAVQYIKGGKLYIITADTKDQAEIIHGAIEDYREGFIPKDELENTLQKYMGDEYLLEDRVEVISGVKHIYSKYYDGWIPFYNDEPVSVDEKTAVAADGSEIKDIKIEKVKDGVWNFHYKDSYGIQASGLVKKNESTGELDYLIEDTYGTFNADADKETSMSVYDELDGKFNDYLTRKAGRGTETGQIAGGFSVSEVKDNLRKMHLEMDDYRKEYRFGQITGEEYQGLKDDLFKRYNPFINQAKVYGISMPGIIYSQKAASGADITPASITRTYEAPQHEAGSYRISSRNQDYPVWTGTVSEIIQYIDDSKDVIDNYNPADPWTENLEKLGLTYVLVQQEGMDTEEAGKGSIIRSTDPAKRPSPSVSATIYPEGYRMEGNDGHTWEIAVASNGVHRWKRVAEDGTELPKPSPMNPIMANGGGFVSKGELVWGKLTDSKKKEFLHKHFTPEITPRSQELLVGKSFQFLPKNVKIVIEREYANVEQYDNGGGIDAWRKEIAEREKAIAGGAVYIEHIDSDKKNDTQTFGYDFRKNGVLVCKADIEVEFGYEEVEDTEDHWNYGTESHYTTSRKREVLVAKSYKIVNYFDEEINEITIGEDDKKQIDREFGAIFNEKMIGTEYDELGSVMLTKEQFDSIMSKVKTAAQGTLVSSCGCAHAAKGIEVSQVSGKKFKTFAAGDEAYGEWLSANENFLNVKYDEYIRNAEIDGTPDDAVMSFETWARDLYEDVYGIAAKGKKIPSVDADKFYSALKSGAGWYCMDVSADKKKFIKWLEDNCNKFGLDSEKAVRLIRKNDSWCTDNDEDMGWFIKKAFGLETKEYKEALEDGHYEDYGGKVVISVAGGVADVAKAPADVDVFIVDKDNIDAGHPYKYNGVEYDRAIDAVNAIKEDYKKGDRKFAVISVDGGIANYELANVVVDIKDYDNEEDEVAARGKNVSEKIKVAFYKWGEYQGDEEIDLIDLPNTQLDSDHLAGFNVRPEDEDKFFYASDLDIDDTNVEEEGYGVKRAYATEKAYPPKFKKGGATSDSLKEKWYDDSKIKNEDKKVEEARETAYRLMELSNHPYQIRTGKAAQGKKLPGEIWFSPKGEGLKMEPTGTALHMIERKLAQMMGAERMERVGQDEHTYTYVLHGNPMMIAAKTSILEEEKGLDVETWGSQKRVHIPKNVIDSEFYVRYPLLTPFRRGGDIGRTYVSKEGIKYWAGKDERGIWTVFSQGTKAPYVWEKRNELESGLASKEDAVHLAKSFAGVIEEKDPEAYFMAHEYEGGGEIGQTKREIASAIKDKGAMRLFKQWESINNHIDALYLIACTVGSGEDKKEAEDILWKYSRTGHQGISDDLRHRSNVLQSKLWKRFKDYAEEIEGVKYSDSAADGGAPKGVLSREEIDWINNIEVEDIDSDILWLYYDNYDTDTDAESDIKKLNDESFETRLIPYKGKRWLFFKTGYSLGDIEKIAAADGKSLSYAGMNKDIVARVMHEFKVGELHDSHGNLVTDRKQAIAIALSMGRRHKAEDGYAADGYMITSESQPGELFIGQSKGGHQIQWVEEWRKPKVFKTEAEANEFLGKYPAFKGLVKPTITKANREKYANILYQIQITEDSWKRNNPEAWAKTLEEFKALHKKLYGDSNVVARVKEKLAADGLELGEYNYIDRILEPLTTQVDYFNDETSKIKKSTLIDEITNTSYRLVELAKQKYEEGHDNWGSDYINQIGLYNKVLDAQNTDCVEKYRENLRKLLEELKRHQNILESMPDIGENGAADGSFIQTPGSLRSLIEVLTDIGIDLEDEDETTVAGLRFELEDFVSSGNDDFATINGHLKAFEEDWLDDIQDAQAKSDIQTAFRIYREGSGGGDGKGKGRGKKAADGTNISEEEKEYDMQVARTIIDQLGGFGTLKMMTGAYNFIALKGGVSFRIKNQKANYIKIELTSMDLYNVEVGRIRGMDYKVVDKAEGLYNDQIKGFVEKATGFTLTVPRVIFPKAEDGAEFPLTPSDSHYIVRAWDTDEDKRKGVEPEIEKYGVRSQAVSAANHLHYENNFGIVEVEDENSNRILTLNAYAADGRMISVPLEEKNRFVDYVYDFYDGEFSRSSVQKATDDYLRSIAKEEWGGGDSFDREKVYNFLKNYPTSKDYMLYAADGTQTTEIDTDTKNRLQLIREMFKEAESIMSDDEYMNLIVDYSVNERSSESLQWWVIDNLIDELRHSEKINEFIQRARDLGWADQYARDGRSVGQQNADMVRSQNRMIKHHSEELDNILDAGNDVPAWVLSKTTRAANDLSDVAHYLEEEKAADGTTVSNRFRITPYKDMGIGSDLITPIYDMSKTVEGVLKDAEKTAKELLESGADVVQVIITKIGATPLKSKNVAIVTTEGVRKAADGVHTTDYLAKSAVNIELLKDYIVQHGSVITIQGSNYGYFSHGPYNLRVSGGRGAVYNIIPYFPEKAEGQLENAKFFTLLRQRKTTHFAITNDGVLVDIVANGAEIEEGDGYIKKNIDDVRVGDIIVCSDGKERTVSKSDIKKDRFMGTTIFGDSWNIGHKPVYVKKVPVWKQCVRADRGKRIRFDEGMRTFTYEKSPGEKWEVEYEWDRKYPIVYSVVIDGKTVDIDDLSQEDNQNVHEAAYEDFISGVIEQAEYRREEFADGGGVEAVEYIRASSAAQAHPTRGETTPMKLVTFTKKNNPAVKIIVKVYPNMSIYQIDNQHNERFPYVVGQTLNMGHRTWACNNGWMVNDEDPCPEKKIFGMRAKDIPEGHPLRHIYPGKFRANGGGVDPTDYDNENPELIEFERGGPVTTLSGTGRDKMVTLEKMIMDKIDAQGGYGQVKAKVATMDNTEPKIQRYAKSQGGNSVLQMMRGKKRFGRMLYNVIDADNLISVQFFDETKRTYADELAAAQKYILKNRHPNLWDDLAKEYSFTEEQLESFRRETDNLSHFEAWQKASDFKLPHIEGHKTITMESAGMPEYAQQQLKDAIDNKKRYSYHWDCGYDCSVSVEMGTDGILRAWFSQEYRGTGNGHYWLLISPTQAIFAEND